MKKKIVFCFLMLGVLLLAGCTNDKKADTDTLYVQKNGKVIGAIVEKLDRDYYDSQELEKWIQSEVDSFNKEHGNGTLKIKKSEFENQEAKVNIIYDSIKDYADFNQVTAFLGTIAQAQDAGYEFSGEFNSTSDKPSITKNEIDGSEEYKVLILEESQKVQMSKPILYVSSNVTVNGNSHKTADLKADKQNLAYIIYK